MTKRTKKPQPTLREALPGLIGMLVLWGPVALFVFHGCSTVGEPSRSQLEQRAACQYSYDHGGPGC